jgi:hypothetical protein
MPQNHPRQGLHLDIGHACALGFGKAANLGLCETDILHIARGDLLHRGFDFRSGQAERGRVVTVEFGRQIPHRRIATRLDICQHGFHRCAGFRIICGPFRVGLSAFEPCNRHLVPRREYVCNIDRPSAARMARRLFAVA